MCVGLTPAAIAKLQAKLPLVKRLKPSLPTVLTQVQASNARLM